uniref:RNA-directed DNA polymerase n=1 Tax=Anas platyrhynchos TaxID=8839 RepID=A0A8B9SRI3_ANAPL
MSIQAMLAGNPGQLEVMRTSPWSVIVQFVTILPVVPLAQQPLKARTVFTDAAWSTHKFAVVWWDGIMWEKEVRQEPGVSLQQLELGAVLLALTRFPNEPLNIITDSQYCFRAAQLCCSCTTPRTVTATLLYSALSKRPWPVFIQHVNSHTEIPGFIIEGNRVADAACYVLDLREAAAQSHHQFHQSALALHRQFHLPLSEARNIVAACCACNTTAPLPAGVNPRGLHPNELWQMDVKEFAPFGRFKYLHVAVDTCSSLMWATASTGQKAKQCIAALRVAIVVLGAPTTLKTDNGPIMATSMTSAICRYQQCCLMVRTTRRHRIGVQSLGCNISCEL